MLEIKKGSEDKSLPQTVFMNTLKSEFRHHESNKYLRKIKMSEDYFDKILWKLQSQILEMVEGRETFYFKDTVDVCTGFRFPFDNIAFENLEFYLEIVELSRRGNFSQEPIVDIYFSINRLDSVFFINSADTEFELDVNTKELSERLSKRILKVLSN